MDMKRKEERESFLRSLSSAGVFMGAEEFEGRNHGSAERFCLLAAHEMLAMQMEKCGGPYCRHIGNGLQEIAFIGEWVKKVCGKIDSFSRSIQEAEYLRGKMAEYLVAQANTRINAELSSQELSAV